MSPHFPYRVVVLLVCILAGTSALRALTITVTDTSDTSGAGTLRDAIAQANAAGSGTTVIINLPSSATFTLSSDTQLLLNTAATVQIVGNGSTIDGNGATRILQIQAGTVNLQGLTFQNAVVQGANGGSTSHANGGGGGGAAGLGGAIYLSGGSLTLTSDQFTNNQVQGGAGGSTNANSFSNGGGAGGGGPAGGAGGSSGGGGGGNGGFGSGGGGGGGTFGGGFGSGGSGGFGGGGGGGGARAGGGSGGSGGAGGTLGGNGGQATASFPAGGGGGAGLGGGVFVATGATLSLVNTSLSNDSAIGGAGHNAGASGSGLGSGFFLSGGTTAISVTSSQTISDTIGELPASSSALSISGGSSLTLSGANSYTGGTTISAGTLQAENNSALGTGNVTVSSGGSLQLTGGVTLANNISISGTGAGGAGAIFSNDVSTANTLNGSVTLAGDASINNSDASHVFFLSGTVGLGTHTLTLGGGGDVQLAGQVTGTGGLTVAANTVGFLTGSTANTYTGLTTVSAGGLLNIAKTTGPAMAGDLDISGTVEDYISGQLTNSTVVTLSGTGLFNFRSQGTTETIAGLNGTSGTEITPFINGGGNTLNIAGSGNYSFAGQINDKSPASGVSSSVALNMNGTGMETLSGTDNYSGGTIVNAGTLAIGNASSLGTGDVTVNGGTLTTALGNHVIDVGGNYTQGANGTLLLTINSLAVHDSLNLTGAGVATLNGTLTLDLVGGFAPGSGQSLTLITTNNPIVGQFSTITTNLPSIGVIANYTDDVTVFFQKSFVSLIGANLTPNQLSVATYLDAHDLTITNPGFNNLIAAINSISGNSQALAGAFNQLTTLNFANFTSSTANNNTSFLTQQFDDYLANHRGADGTFVGSNGGIDYSGLIVSDPNVDSALQMVHSRLLAWSPAPGSGLISDVPNSIFGGVDMKDSKMMLSPEPVNPWNVFISGNVVLAQDFSDAPSGLAHADATTGAVQFGADYRISPHWLVGAFFGYGHTDATLDTLGSTASVDTYSPGVYASYSNHGWYANAIGSYGFADYDQDRKVAIGAFNGTAHSSPGGDQIVGNLDGGYDFHRGHWTFGPTLGTQYVHLDVDGFTETGLPGADLTVNQNESDSLRSRLGGRVSYAVQDGEMTFTPHLNASWQHEFLDQSRGVTSQFDGLGAGSFTVRTPNPSRDSALVDLGLDAQIDKTWTVFTDYTVQAGQDNYFGQSVQAGVKIGF